MIYHGMRHSIFVSLYFLSTLALPLLASSSILGEDIPNVTDTPSFYIRNGWIKLKCMPIEIVTKEGDIDKVKYHCMQNYMKQIDENSSEQTKEARGTDETERMREKVQKKVDAGAIYTVYLPLHTINNIRRNRFMATQQITEHSHGKIVDLLLPARLYVSLRPQFSGDGIKNIAFHDGGSRGGFFYYHQFDNYISLMLQYEASINFNNDTPFINLSDASNSSRRLSYLSLEYEKSSIIIGKYWSPYYGIAAFTDYFMAYGSSASGAFNNQSDGSASGTGRSDQAIQLRTKREKFDLAIQFQADHNASNNLTTHYNYTLASSIIYKEWMGLKAGISFVYGSFDEITAEMYSKGIDGNEQSYIAGLSYVAEKINVNGIVTYSKNHINDDQGYYFDALGTELYMHYDYSDTIRIAYGINWLIPVDDKYEGAFSIKKSIVSLQYTFNKKTFDDLVYVELSLPYGRLANGEQSNTTIAIGLRYLFDY